MKNFNLILVLLVFVTFNCNPIDAQTVKGTGSIVSKTIDMDRITSLGLGISANVYVKQGAKQKIVIKGQQNIIDLIKTKPKGRTWSIEFERGVHVKNYEQLEVYVTMAELDGLSIGGSGSIIGENKFTKVGDLGISIGGSGDIKLETDADEVSVSIGGSGDVKLKGSADELSISIGGSGDVNAVDLSVKECSVSAAGSGDIEVNVSGSLDVSLVGSSDVRYKGNPKVTKSIVGSGNISSY